MKQFYIHNSLLLKRTFSFFYLFSLLIKKCNIIIYKMDNSYAPDKREMLKSKIR